MRQNFFSNLLASLSYHSSYILDQSASASTERKNISSIIPALDQFDNNTPILLNFQSILLVSTRHIVQCLGQQKFN